MAGAHLRELTRYGTHTLNKQNLSRRFTFSHEFNEETFTHVDTMNDKNILKTLYEDKKGQVLTKKIIIHEASFVTYLRNLERNMASVQVETCQDFSTIDCYKLWCTTVPNEICGI